MSVANWPRLVLLPLVPALIALLVTLNRMDQGGGSAPAEAAMAPRYTLKQAELTRFNAEGEPELSAVADTIDYFDDASGVAHDLQVDLISAGVRTWHLKSPTASMPTHQHRFLLDGPVLVDGHWPDNGEPVQAQTSSLWVDPDAHSLQTDDAVDVRSVSRNGNANGMNADWAGHNLDLLHRVRMTYVTPR